MSRFDDYDDEWTEAKQVLWDQAVKNAINGRRGQAFLRELIAALDELPKHELVEGFLATAEGGVCAMGAAAARRLKQGREIRVSHFGTTIRALEDLVDYSGEHLDDWERNDRTRSLGVAMGIAECLALRIAYANDEEAMYSQRAHGETAEEQRWRIVRNWAQSQLKPEPVGG